MGKLSCQLTPAVDIVLIFVLAGAGVWLFAQLDQAARSTAQSRRERGYPIADYDQEIRKWKKRYRWMGVASLLSSLAGILNCVSSLHS